MGSNTPNFPQGSYGQTQPAQPATQYGNSTQYPLPNPYYVPPPPPPKPNRGWIYVTLGLVLLVVILIGTVLVLLLGRKGDTASTAGTPTSASSTTTVITPTIAPTQPVISANTPTTVVTQATVDSTTQGIAICSSSTCSSYSTQANTTVICSGDVSVITPSGNRRDPDSDQTTGEEVAITGAGYTIIFTNSASCTKYPALTSDQVNKLLDNIESQQQHSGCVNNAGCTGPEQRWVFP